MWKRTCVRTGTGRDTHQVFDVERHIVHLKETLRRKSNGSEVGCKELSKGKVADLVPMVHLQEVVQSQRQRLVQEAYLETFLQRHLNLCVYTCG